MEGAKGVGVQPYVQTTFKKRTYRENVESMCITKRQIQKYESLMSHTRTVSSRVDTIWCLSRKWLCETGARKEPKILIN